MMFLEAEGKWDLGEEKRGSPGVKAALHIPPHKTDRIPKKRPVSY